MKSYWLFIFAACAPTVDEFKSTAALCQSGAINSCVCSGGAQGTQACDSAGTAFSDCDCTTIAVTPATTILSVGAAQQFTSSVTGAAAGVTWSVVESGATVTSDGNFTSTATGTFHLVATSTADASKSATAIITVVDAPVKPVIDVPAIVAASSVTSITASIDVVAPDATYDWTVTGGQLQTASRGDQIQFTAPSVGIIILEVNVTNAAGDSASPGIMTVEVVAPIDNSTPLTIIAPATLTEKHTHVPLTATPVDSGLTYSWQITGGSLENPSATDATVYFTTPFAPATVAVQVTATSVTGAPYGTAQKQITIVPGGGVLELMAGQPGGAGNTDGIGSNSRFNDPQAIAAAPDGTLYVIDSDNFRIVSPTLNVTTMGSVQAESVTVDGAGNYYTVPNNTPGKIYKNGALWNSPGNTIAQIAASPNGDVFVLFSGVPNILKIDSSSSTTQIAGGNGTGCFDGASGSANIASPPMPLATAPSGAELLYFVQGRAVRTITPAGVISSTGFGGGTGALCSGPLNGDETGIAVAADGTVYVSSPLNVAKLVNESGTWTRVTIAGGTNPGAVDGAPSDKQFTSITGIALSADGNTLFVNDHSFVGPDYGAVRAIGPLNGTLQVKSVVGDIPHTGNSDTSGATTFLSSIDAAAEGPDGTIYVVEDSLLPLPTLPAVPACDLRAIDLDDNVRTILSTDCSGQDGPPGFGTLSAVTYGGLAIDSDGTIALAANIQGPPTVLQEIRALSADGTLALSAGGTPSYSAGFRSSALFALPSGLVFGTGGNLFIADQGNDFIRLLFASGEVVNLAGGTGGGNADQAAGAKTAKFNKPTGLALDASGDNLYIADTNNSAIRRLSLVDQSVKTVASNLAVGVLGSEGITTLCAGQFPVLNAYSPFLLSIDRDENLYLATASSFGGTVTPPTVGGAINFGVFRISDPRAASCSITPLIGSATSALRGVRLGANPSLGGPSAMFVNRYGDVIIADGAEHVLLRLRL